MARPSSTDVREAPIYTAAEAAHYLRVPPSTVRAWAFGQRYRWRDETRSFQPVISAADRKARRLSFINLVELFVLAAIRRTHSVGLPQVRRAVGFLKRQFPTEHPLADHYFQTNGVDLFVEKFGEILNISRDGQVEMKELIRAHLRCVERDPKGVPMKLYLVPRKHPSATRTVVVIDPRVGFGRPVLDGTGIRTEILIERFSAGERIEELAADYGRSPAEIEDVVRCELPLAA
jgi:uncharacterized protein (DUF433 family)